MASVPTGSDPLPQKEPRCTCTTVPRDSASSRTRTGLRMHINAHRNEARHESPKRATPFGGKLNLKLSFATRRKMKVLVASCRRVVDALLHNGSRQSEVDESCRGRSACEAAASCEGSSVPNT